jgi:hypothetical protein
MKNLVLAKRLAFFVLLVFVLISLGFLFQGNSTGKVIIIDRNVSQPEYLFDASVFILDKQITWGESVIAQVDLEEVRASQPVEVKVHYEIRNSYGSLYLEEEEGFEVENEKRYVKEFSSESLIPGDYILGLEVHYPGAFAVSSTQFSVVSESERDFLFVLKIVFVVLAVFVIGFGLWKKFG